MPEGEYILNLRATGTEQFAQRTQEVSKGLEQTSESVQVAAENTQALARGLNAVERAALSATAALGAMAAKAAASAAGKAIATKIPGVAVTLEKYLPPLGALGIIAKEAGQISEADKLNQAADAAGKTVEQFQLLSQLARITKTDVNSLASALKQIEASQLAALKGDKDAAGNFSLLGGGNLQKQTPLQLLANITRLRPRTRAERDALSALTGGQINGLDDIGGALAGLDGLQVPGGQVQGLAEVADTVRSTRRGFGTLMRAILTTLKARSKQFATGTAAGVLGAGELGIAGATQGVGGLLGLLGLSGAKEYLGRVAESTLFAREKLWGNVSEEIPNGLGGNDPLGEELRGRYARAKAAAERRKAVEEEKKSLEAKKDKMPLVEREWLELHFGALQGDAMQRMGGFAGGIRQFGLSNTAIHIQQRMEQHQRKMEEHLGAIRNEVEKE